MGKIKSAICLTLITILIAVLCVVCFVPFPVGWDEEGKTLSFYNPIINWTNKSSDLGGYQFGGSDPAYVGGSYTVVFYPEGVISRKEYEDNTADRTESDNKDYEKQYVQYKGGAIYLNKDTVCDGGNEPSAKFKEAFADRLAILKERFERIHQQGMKLEVRDDYTVTVSLPATSSSTAVAFLYFSYMGDVTVRYGSDSSSATIVFPKTGSNAKPITSYIKGAGTRSSGNTEYVSIAFTEEGQRLVASATSAATSESTGSLYIMVGEEQVVALEGIESELNQPELIVSSTSYTADSAAVIAAVIDTAVKYSSDIELKINQGEIYRMPASFGDNALTFAYIAFGVCFAAMVAYFLIRYRRLGFSHILTYLVYLIALTLTVWAIPLEWSVGTIAALAVSSILLCVSDAISYEYARKEFATGKTMESSVKTGYKKCFLSILDAHVVLLIVALLTYLIALTELQAFALVLLFGTAISALCSLAVNRFLWYITMPFAKSPAQFCHFKREEVEDDD